MNDKLKEMRKQLQIINSTLMKPYTNKNLMHLQWLENLGEQFLKFYTDFQASLIKRQDNYDGDLNTEMMILCLRQIAVCLRYTEYTITVEVICETIIWSSRQYFVDRIHYCLQRLVMAINIALENPEPLPPLEEQTFVMLFDLALDHLLPYTMYIDIPNITEDNESALVDSQQIFRCVKQLLNHVMAFSNVALKGDQKALTALSQKVLSECLSYQAECVRNQQENKLNQSDRKLKALSLENALSKLEKYLNDSMLRLLCKCLIVCDDISIERLRNVIQSEDEAVNELIADFDANIDRITQIGIFAIAFAPNLKIRTIVRSCLASLESLDTAIIPALKTKTRINLHSEILEKHFNEEIKLFRLIMQETIDSHAFISCYQEALVECMDKMQKELDKRQLLELIKTGGLLLEHFRLKVNFVELAKESEPKRMHYYQSFVIVLQECEAIIKCDVKVDDKRILKRFNILTSILTKLRDSYSTTIVKDKQIMSGVSLSSHKAERILQSNGIVPPMCNIFYSAIANNNSQVGGGFIKRISGRLKSQPDLDDSPTLVKPKTSRIVQPSDQTIKTIGLGRSRTKILSRNYVHTNLFKHLSSEQLKLSVALSSFELLELKGKQ